MTSKNMSTFKSPLARTSDGNINTPAAAERPCEQDKRALEEQMEESVELTTTTTTTTTSDDNDDNDDDDDEAAAAAAAAAEQNGGGNPGSNNKDWTLQELSWAMLARAKYYGEQRQEQAKKGEQEVGVFKFFKAYVLKNTQAETERSATGLAQRANREEQKLRDAQCNVRNDHCGAGRGATFHPLNKGVLALRTGRTMEIDGEYAFVKSFEKAYGREVSENKKEAIAQVSENPIYTFWKQYGIANPVHAARAFHLKKSIPMGDGKISDKTPQNQGRKEGRRSVAGSTKKKVRKNDVANDINREGRVSASQLQMNLQQQQLNIQDRAILLRYCEMLPENNSTRIELLDEIGKEYKKKLRPTSTPNTSQNAAAENNANIVTLDDSDSDDGKDVNVNVANNVSKGDE